MQIWKRSVLVHLELRMKHTLFKHIHRLDRGDEELNSVRTKTQKKSILTLHNTQKASHEERNTIPKRKTIAAGE